MSSSNTSTSLTFVPVGVAQGITGLVWTIKKLDQNKLVCSVEGSTGSIFTQPMGARLGVLPLSQEFQEALLRLRMVQYTELP